MSNAPDWDHPVNAPTPVNGQIRIVPYNHRWPFMYERERDRIVNVLGERGISIDHVGSTSVPGLAAKPIIDILLVVVDCADEDAFVPDLEEAGYVLRIREPADTANPLFDGTEPHLVFKGAEIDLNLHVWTSGSGEVVRNLLFRDWLRHNSADRELYERTKLDLACRDWQNVQQYAEAKTNVIEEIRGRAGAATQSAIG